MKKVLVIGATSVIAQETIKILAEEGAEFYLVARNHASLQAIASDLQVRGVTKVNCMTMNSNDVQQHQVMLDNALTFLAEIDLVFIAHGVLPDQNECQQSIATMLETINTNFTSTIALLTLLANYFEVRKQGMLAVITSVAGDRGRQSNYVYGAAKAGVSVFLQGLRNRLYKSNVQVLDIKPGFVETPMIAHLPKNFLWAKPDYVARKIIKAINNKKQVLYVPWFWFFIMLVVKLTPKFVFNRLSF